MTILTSDLVFFAASFQTDEPSGGGLPSGLAVQDGEENNLFPDVAPGDRDLGRVQLRKFYPSVVSANTDALLTAQCLVSEPPEDAAVGVVLFRFGNENTTREQAAPALELPAYQRTGQIRFYNQSGILGTNEINIGGPATSFQAGQLIELYSGATTLFGGPSITGVSGPRGQVIVESVGIEFLAGGVTYTRLTINEIRSDTSGYAYEAEPNAAAPACCGVVLSTATSGSDSILVERVQHDLCPVIEPFPTAVNGLRPAELRRSNGKVPLFREGELVLIENSTESETAVVASIDYRGTLNFTEPLANTYSAGARVSSLLALGDLRAVAGPGFSQQTWTRTFSDTLIGTPAAGSYNRSIFPFELTNEGSVTERWAIVWTGADTFQLIGETRGLVAFGSRFEIFEPNNPQVNVPFFTIQPEGWSEGWSTGNVYRFNTTGASAPVWAARTVSPSEPGSLVSAVIKLRGGVDA